MPTLQNGQTHSNNLSAVFRQIAWVCWTIFWGWRLKVEKGANFWRKKDHHFKWIKLIKEPSRHFTSSKSMMETPKTMYEICWKLAKNTAQKMKFSIKDFFIKCDQIRSFLRNRSHLLKKSLMENLIFCAEKDTRTTYVLVSLFLASNKFQTLIWCFHCWLWTITAGNN